MTLLPAHEFVGPGDDDKDLVRVVMDVERRPCAGVIVVLEDAELAARGGRWHQDADVYAEEVEHFGLGTAAVEGLGHGIGE